MSATFISASDIGSCFSARVERNDIGMFTELFRPGESGRCGGVVCGAPSSLSQTLAVMPKVAIVPAREFAAA
ncbi:hypothetical protein CVN68_13975 [Sphingomonas psychrotolerans]|uniref:Uncharacterized protein n=1 Tax=Sphingomonas psychrotolerans TaxID=1327635 RepID=A0A2K8MGE2_9SPHN|nr:hypothetical protein CVN68_13975 [Sphingomonas psychrotolerans]